MTQEEKQLLLKDLCARLPYLVKGLYQWKGNVPFDRELDGRLYDELYLSLYSTEDSSFKPYLRPMDSMTEEEYYGEYQRKVLIMRDADETLHWLETVDSIDWLIAHHFDYRGLIPMGLALEAPERMYNKEESEKGSEIPIPKTVDEAVKTLAKIVSEEDRDYLLENGAISMHDSMGRWIRNEWGLWTDSELKNELKKKGFEHPDDMSNYIIEEFIKYCLEKLI